MRSFVTALMAGAQIASAKMTDAPYFYKTDRPVIVAHRGAFGHFPEHSIASYDDAYYGGTDYIEMDLQVSKDGHLICQHDAYLDVTTNVAEYADQFKHLKRLDGKYYVNDFTLSELKLLKRKQRYQTRSQLLNDKFEMLTLPEIIANVNMLNADNPRTVNSATTVGLYIELKDYNTTLDKMGVDMAVKMDEVLRNNGLGTIEDCTDKMPIIVQSFEFDALKKYATLSDLPLVQLAHYSKAYSYDWDEISTVAHGVGPDSNFIMNPDSLNKVDTSWDKSTAANTYSVFVTKMHELELAVHPWTLKDDQLVYRATAYEENQLYVDNGIDGVFTEFAHSTNDLFTHMGSKAAWPPASSSPQSFLQ